MFVKSVNRYHISVLTTNLTAVVISIFFLRAYIAKGFDIVRFYAILLLILAIFIVLFLYINKPSKKKTRLLPETGLLATNLLLAFIMSILFVRQIGVTGVILTLLFAFLLAEAEHLIHGAISK